MSESCNQGVSHDLCSGWAAAKRLRRVRTGVTLGGSTAFTMKVLVGGMLVQVPTVPHVRHQRRRHPRLGTTFPQLSDQYGGATRVYAPPPVIHVRVYAQWLFPAPSLPISLGYRPLFFPHR